MKLEDKNKGINNLLYYLSKADDIDIFEARNAYKNYHIMLNNIAIKYGFSFNKTVAAFCALSPNNDYFGNLRSLVSILHGINKRISHNQIIVSTYNHCKYRAINYLIGNDFFDSPKRGLKIINFYKNILYPESEKWVTIDGHIAAAYQGNSNLNMKDVFLTKANYIQIAESLKLLSSWSQNLSLPNQLQAAIWFARKRIYKIKYNPNYDMFYSNADRWRIIIPVDEIRPYDQKTLEKFNMATQKTQKIQMQMQQTLLSN